MYSPKNIKLEEYQNLNGLFPAAIKSDNKLMNNHFWIRDNYYIYLAAEQETKTKMLHAFKGIVDYLTHLNKFNNKPEQEWEYIHPLYNNELKEINSRWSWVQNDCAGNLLEILAESKDKKRSNLILNYLDAIEYWNCPDYGFWEEGPREVRSSSLSACIRGIESFEENINVTEQTIHLKNKGYESLNSLLPNETKTRRYDLALLSVIYPKQIVEDNMKKRILNNAELHLEKFYGLIRYHGDTWNGKENNLGKNKEMAWVLGLPWLYLASKKTFPLLKSLTLKKTYRTLPEGMINGAPNCTSLLIWSEAMHKLAVNDFEKRAQEHKTLKKMISQQQFSVLPVPDNHYMNSILV